MPELPDVEVYRRYLDHHALNEEIEGFSTDLEGLREHVSASTLRRRLSGHELAETRRHGKYLFVRGVGDGWLTRCTQA